MNVKIEAAFDSDVGRYRVRNEDNCYFDGAVMQQNHEGPPNPIYRSFEPDGVFFAIFDGMGGVEDGEVASYLAGCVFQDACAKLAHRSMLSESFFYQTVQEMDAAICAEAVSRGNQMGTTFAALAFCDDLVFVSNVGDSRVYRLREDTLMQLSVDDVGRANGQGNRKAGLTQCLGAPGRNARLNPHILLGRVQVGDVYLLCSDGLTDMVPSEQIAEMLRSQSRADVCAQKLVDTALEHGGRDNVTVIVMQVTNKSDSDL